MNFKLGKASHTNLNQTLKSQVSTNYSKTIWIELLCVLFNDQWSNSNHKNHQRCLILMFFPTETRSGRPHPLTSLNNMHFTLFCTPSSLNVLSVISALAPVKQDTLCWFWLLVKLNSSVQFSLRSVLTLCTTKNNQSSIWPYEATELENNTNSRH